MLRESPVYRRDAFDSGLRACGYHVERGRGAVEIRPSDVLVIWNRYGFWDDEAKKFEAAGATVLVAENSPLGREWRGGYWYTLCRNYHNAIGHFPVGGPERWDSWDVELAPWRESGDHILVLPQRGFGAGPYKQPDDWTQRILGWLRKRTDRPVRVRQHPGTADPRPVDHGLLADLAGAHCVVTWGSGAALKAMLHGWPCFHGCPKWIGIPASTELGTGSLESPNSDNRLPMFRQLAWCMWSLPEIERGEPFKWLPAESTR